MGNTPMNGKFWLALLMAGAADAAEVVKMAANLDLYGKCVTSAMQATTLATSLRVASERRSAMLTAMVSGLWR